MLNRPFNSLVLPVLWILLVPPAGHTQEWTLMNPSPTIENLFGACFLNPDTGFVCGAYGKILKTVDGGISWQEHDTLTYDSYEAMVFLNQDTGFAVGSGGTIVRTTNCGESWGTTGPFINTGYNDLFFLDDTFGWAVGNYNTLVRTTDGGETWNVLSHSVYSDDHYLQVRFISPDTGYVSGQYGSWPQYGILKKSCDGGATWSDLFVPQETLVLKGLEVTANQNVWIGNHHQIVGTGATCLYHTTNDGLSWDTVTLIINGPTVEEITFLTPLNGKVLTSHILFATDDGGATWTSHPIATPGNLFGMSWPDSTHCVTVGYAGYIFRTENAGLDWSPLSLGIRLFGKDLVFKDDQNGCIAGREGDGISIYFTDNGGLDWTPATVDFLLPDESLNTIAFDGNETGWAAGLHALLRSDDSGSSWYHVDEGSGYWFYTLDIVPGGYIWVGGLNGTLIRSTNNGASWEDISLPVQGCIKFLGFSDPLTGYLVNWYSSGNFYSQLYKTTDGGVSWTMVTFPGNYWAFRSMAVTGDQTVYLADNNYGILKSTDGGDNWTLIGEVAGRKPPYIQFFDTETGLASIGDWFIAYTFDGGVTWDVALDAPSHPVYSQACYFTDQSAGWQVGDDGLIERYLDPTVGVPETNPACPATGAPVIYPNPAEHTINIHFRHPVTELTILDQWGRSLSSVHGVDIKRLDIGYLPPGIYLLELQSEGMTFHKKLIRTR